MTLLALSLEDIGAILVFTAAAGAWFGPWVAISVLGLGLLVEGIHHTLGGDDA